MVAPGYDLSDGGFVSSYDDLRPWVTGWLDWSTSTQNTNLDYLLNPQHAVLAQYFGKQKNIYLCPADKYASNVQRARGWSSRVRSVSGNIYVGKGNGWFNDPRGRYSKSGPYNEAVYKGASKVSDLLTPGAAQT